MNTGLFFELPSDLAQVIAFYLDHLDNTVEEPFSSREIKQLLQSKGTINLLTIVGGNQIIRSYRLLPGSDDVGVFGRGETHIYNIGISSFLLILEGCFGTRIRPRIDVLRTFLEARSFFLLIKERLKFLGSLGILMARRRTLKFLDDVIKQLKDSDHLEAPNLAEIPSFSEKLNLQAYFLVNGLEAVESDQSWCYILLCQDIEKMT